MKYNLIVLGLLIGAIEGINIRTGVKDDEVVNTSSELDALMDKYDAGDKKSSKAQKTSSAEPKADGTQPSKSQIQDMELKILQGNNLAESSQKTADDDLQGEILEKFSTSSKADKNAMILTKENAEEASVEIYSRKWSMDSFDAQDKVKNLFAKIWKEHDINNKGFIDQSEGYTLFADIIKE